MVMEALAPDGADTVPYVGDDEVPRAARVRCLDDVVAAAEAAADAPLEERPVGDPATLPLPAAEVAAPVGRGRHSATELMVFKTCRRRHWYRYIAGIREPSLAGGGPAWKSATVRGQVVHDVLEHLLEEEDAERLLEDAIERHAPDAPQEDVPAGSRYRAALREEIERVAGHPAYRALADHPDARRELAFLAILGDGRYADGFFDLAAPGDAGLRILDVKTGDTPPAQALAKYAPQRNVYVSAAEAISGGPVEDFLFAFSRLGVVESAGLPPGGSTAARDGFLAAIATMERGDRALATDPNACWTCGYRKVRLCPGAPRAERG